MPETKKTEYQFKLYASKFPVWWTHNSIDMPDPTYFEHLNDPENKDGFNWLEVPFTFNYKDQFTGTIIADDQYYTIFRLVDSKDSKFPNKYFLVESVNKAFQGGYELEMRLDVFTTYGLDFWTNGVKNPLINTKTVNLNRTNHAGLLLTYYYQYDNIMATRFSNWSYLDPLLKFESMPTFTYLANWLGYYQGAYTTPPIWINEVVDYTWSADHWNGSVKTINDSFNLYGKTAASSLELMTLTSIRYYIFKPLVGDNDMYWLVWTITPREWQDTWKIGDTMEAVQQKTGTIYPFHVDYYSFKRIFIDGNYGFGGKLIGVFDGPPITAIGHFSADRLSGSSKPILLINYGTRITSFNGDHFLISKVHITPDKTTGIPAPDGWSGADNYFTGLSIYAPTNFTGSRELPNTVRTDLSMNLFGDVSDNDFSIRYLTANGVNNVYILQKAKVADLQYTPFMPLDMFKPISWHEDVYTNSPFIVPRQLAKLAIPNVCYITSSGLRLGVMSNELNINTTLWTLPTSLPVATDEFAQYMTSALINQNNSMAIAKQQRDMGIVDAVAGGITGVAGAAMSGGKGGILGAVSSLFNMGSNIAKSQLAYENKQKTYDAQNAAARATMSVNINSSVDKDTSQQIIMSSMSPGIVNKYQWLHNFNWAIPIQLPSLMRDRIFYNNLIYLNGFFVDCQIKISELELDWNNHSKLTPGVMPHLYYDCQFPQEIIKFHYSTLNLELLGAITTLFNNGIRFWANFPDYSQPWYWITNWEKDDVKPIKTVGGTTTPAAPKPTPPPVATNKYPISGTVQNRPWANPGATPTYGYGSNMNAHAAIVPTKKK